MERSFNEIIGDLLHSGINYEQTGSSRASSSSEGSVDNASSFDRQLEILFDQISTVVSAERSLIDTEKQKVSKRKQKFTESLNAKWLELKSKQETWEQNLKKAKSLLCKSEEIIEVSVGGTHEITTTIGTLSKVPDSALAAMFSGRHPVTYHKGKAFVDRDGEPFTHMINFLRTQQVPVFTSRMQEAKFYEELDFWGIPSDLPNSYIDQSLRAFDEDWCASTLFLDNQNTSLRKIGNTHGMAFGANSLCAKCPYIEFKISISAPSNTGSHVFVGVVDKSKYNSSHLESTLWKDAPSSWYWDVWSTKLIKTDENGLHTVVTGYGCDCEEDETTIGIFYDSRAKELSFYKNGICQGIAFKGVPTGLNPSIDVWFESGTVTIQQLYFPVPKKFM